MTLRGLGIPKTDAERVMAHYNIDQEEATQWLQIHPVSELLPERGAGLFIGNPGVAAVPGEKLTVMVGDTVRVRFSVDYMGPAIDGAVWVAIGRQNLWFAEDFASRTPVHFDESFDFVTYDIICDVDIGNRPGSNYDLYAKIMEVPGPDIFTDILLNIIDVLGAVEFRNFAITSYEKV